MSHSFKFQFLFSIHNLFSFSLYIVFLRSFQLSFFYSIFIISVSVFGLCTDTSDPRQFGTISLVPKCLTFLCRCRSVFGTLRHWCRTVSTFYEGAEVSNGHFGTSAEVSRTDRRPVHVLVSLHHLTSRLHHPSRSSDSVSRHFVYTKSYPDIHI